MLETVETVRRSETIEGIKEPRGGWDAEAVMWGRDGRTSAARQGSIPGAAIFTPFLLLILMLAVLTMPLRAMAADDDFEVKGTASASESEGTVTVNLEVTNESGDFGGYVRLLLSNSYYVPMAYERYVSIADGETEEVSIVIPLIDSYQIEDATVRVQVLDDKHRVLYETRLRRIFEEQGTLYGVLSDHPGNLYYFEGMSNASYSSAGAWEQSDRDLSDLSDVSELAGLSYLLIDDFDLSSLPEEGIAAIESWVSSGGVVIIGTGESTDRTFAAFDDDFIDAQYVSASAGGMGVYDEDSYYAQYGTIPYADLLVGSSYDYSLSYQYGSYDNMYMKRYGRGGIVLLQFSLSTDDLDTYYLVHRLIDRCADLTDGVTQRESLSPSMYRSLFNVMQGAGYLNRAVLRLIVIVYVMLVGPILYLVLKKLDKREKVWIAIPALSLFFVLLIFLVGRGFGIRTKQLETITVAAADGRGTQVEYLFGFDAKSREWNITLSDETLALGPAVNPSSYSSSDEDYRYLSSIAPSGVKAYYRPDGVFDAAFFKAYAPNQLYEQGNGAENGSGGRIDYDLRVVAGGNIRGDVDNETDYDFDYYLVYVDGSWSVVEGTSSGQSISLNEKPLTGSSMVSSVRSAAESVYSREADYESAREYCALAMAGLELEGNASFVVGVLRNPQRVVESGVREDAFLCIYSVK